MIIPSTVRCTIRQIWIYPPLKYAVIAGVCAWATYIQIEYRVPSSFMFLLLPWIGIVLATLHIVLLANYFLTRLDKDHPMKATLRQIEWWANLIVRIHVYF